MKKMPIKAAKDLAEKYGQDMVILVTWEQKTNTTHTVSYGRTLEQCEAAANSINKVRAVVGFPPEKCAEVPARVKKNKAELRRVAEAVQHDLWYALKAALGAGKHQQILSREIDLARDRLDDVLAAALKEGK